MLHCSMELYEIIRPQVIIRSRIASNAISRPHTMRELDQATRVSPRAVACAVGPQCGLGSDVMTMMLKAGVVGVGGVP